MAESIKPELFSPLTLAYLGDAVLELIVREHYIRKSNKQVQKYHKDVTAVVSAISQSAFIDSIESELTEEETAIYHRGRNASVHTMAKHATMAEYKKATGFEALLGYLYLKNDRERLMKLVRLLLEQHGEEEMSDGSDILI